MSFLWYCYVCEMTYKPDAIAFEEGDYGFCPRCQGQETEPYDMAMAKLEEKEEANDARDS